MPNGSHWSIGAVELEAVEAVFVSAHHGTRASAKLPRWGKGWVRVHCDLTSTSILSLPFPSLSLSLYPPPPPFFSPLSSSYIPHSPSLTPPHLSATMFKRFVSPNSALPPLSSLFPANSSLAVSPGPSGGLLLPGLPPSPAAPCPSSPP